MDQVKFRYILFGGVVTVISTSFFHPNLYFMRGSVF